MTEQVITLQYALNPTKEQIQKLSSHSGAVRYAFNYALGKTVENWEQVKNNPDTEYIKPNAYAMRKLFNQEKQEIAPWWKENSKEAYNTGFANYQNAIQRFLKKQAGFPRFKAKHLNDNEGIIFTTGTRRLEEGRKHFTVPTIGKIRLYERATKLAYLLRHSGRITNVTVKYARTRWFINVAVRVTQELWQQYHLLRTKKNKKKVVGVDIGVKHAAVFSDGTVIENPRAYEKQLRKLRVQQKELSRRKKLNKRTGEMPSNRYSRSRQQLRKTYAKIANQELDFAHKLSKRLVDDYEVIGLEDLNVSGMMRNRRMARHIAHSGFGRLRLFVEYKARAYGSSVVLVNRFFPSSKSCSKCGVVRAKLSLSERVFECFDCGFVLDRDLNAALNIRKVAQSCGETVNEHGEESSGLVTSETILGEVLSGAGASQPN